jgi:hypothetical protein
MPTLYEDGWRQGTILAAHLPLDAVLLGGGQPVCDQREHRLWAVASQECDLDQTDHAAIEATIELRPVFTDDPPDDFGIRSSRFLLTEHEYVISISPRTVVSAAVLTELVRQRAERRDPSMARRQAFKTWLGLRYDRPAVPLALLPLAQRISEEVRRRRRREGGRRVRDVLMQFEEVMDPVRFSLYAVLENDEDTDRVREWLADISQAIPPELGLADEIEAATAAGISLHTVETSYAADVSQLTWRPNQPEPEGAT